jgi:hypothetical protein
MVTSAISSRNIGTISHAATLPIQMFVRVTAPASFCIPVTRIHSTTASRRRANSRRRRCLSGNNFGN